MQEVCTASPKLRAELALARQQLDNLKTTSRALHGEKRKLFTLPLTELPSAHDTFHYGFK